MTPTIGSRWVYSIRQHDYHNSYCFIWNGKEFESWSLHQSVPIAQFYSHPSYLKDLNEYMQDGSLVKIMEGLSSLRGRIRAWLT